MYGQNEVPFIINKLKQQKAEYNWSTTISGMVSNF